MFTSPRSSSSAFSLTSCNQGKGEKKKKKKRKRRETRDGGRKIRLLFSVCGVLGEAPLHAQLRTLKPNEGCFFNIYNLKATRIPMGNLSLSLSSSWFFIAVNCIIATVSQLKLHLWHLLSYQPFVLFGKRQQTSSCFPIGLPNVDWRATCVLFFFFLHLFCIFIIIIFISTCCLRELTSEQYAHVKISNGTLAFLWSHDNLFNLFYFYRTVV